MSGQPHGAHRSGRTPGPARRSPPPWHSPAPTHLRAAASRSRTVTEADCTRRIGPLQPAKAEHSPILLPLQQPECGSEVMLIAEDPVDCRLPPLPVLYPAKMAHDGGRVHDRDRSARRRLRPIREGSVGRFRQRRGSREAPPQPRRQIEEGPGQQEKERRPAIRRLRECAAAHRHKRGSGQRAAGSPLTQRTRPAR